MRVMQLRGRWRLTRHDIDSLRGWKHLTHIHIGWVGSTPLLTLVELRCSFPHLLSFRRIGGHGQTVEMSRGLPSPIDLPHMQAVTRSPSTPLAHEMHGGRSQTRDGWSPLWLDDSGLPTAIRHQHETTVYVNVRRAVESLADSRRIAESKTGGSVVCGQPG
mmetsp:Transcript_12508/g.29871  ORF Transcript_12508/g.29871 Transcript_12508/m.29871 type:complete len:161 (-) Transcript_12508:379-861(-)